MQSRALTTSWRRCWTNWPRGPGQNDVLLKLEEQVPDAAFYREYKTARYTLRSWFTSDFDF